MRWAPLAIALLSLCCARPAHCRPGDSFCHIETWFFVSRFSCAVKGYCQIYLTTLLSGGATFSGVAGADALCNSDVNRPSLLSTYKAFLASSSGTVRRATVTANLGDGQVDWVLQPNMRYFRGDGVTLIGTTASNGLLGFNLANAPTGTSSYWTGMNTSWQHAADCAGWSFSGTGLLGNGLQVSSAAISGAGQNCNFPGFGLLCAEQ